MTRRFMDNHFPSLTTAFIQYHTPATATEGTQPANNNYRFKKKKKYQGQL